MEVYTVMGHLLHECPLNLLKQEAEAGRALKRDHDAGQCRVSSFAKLDAVEREITIRRAVA